MGRVGGQQGARRRGRPESSTGRVASRSRPPFPFLSARRCSNESQPGYGYYRTSTRTSNKKIYYYRCLGSDDYRYENGRVCWSKPVRADYLDEVVWEHITELISDPTLIRGEIDSRLRQARNSDPAKREREQVELALTKTTTAIARMIEAFQEQMITIDELRARMPELRTRETNLRGQLDALDSQIADRQRVLRLLVKNVLIGSGKITIRHRIPLRQRASDRGTPTASTDTESDRKASCQVRWGVVSPVLSNIYLHRLDEFVETVLIPEYTRGERRAPSPDYERAKSAARRARARRPRHRAETVCTAVEHTRRGSERSRPPAAPLYPLYRRRPPRVHRTTGRGGTDQITPRGVPA